MRGWATLLLATVLLAVLRLASTAQAQDADGAHTQGHADGDDPCATVRRGSPEADACAQREYATAQASQRPLPPFVVPPPGSSPQPTIASLTTLIHQWSEITQCALEQTRRDPTFSPWSPSELIELPPDASSLAPLDGPGPPPLAPAEP